MSETKELDELLKACDMSADAIAAAKSDGTIDWRDLPKLGPPLLAWKDAVIGAENIPTEMKQLSRVELIEKLTQALQVFQKLGAALLTATEAAK